MDAKGIWRTLLRRAGFSRAAAMGLWADFVRTAEDKVSQENAIDGEIFWEMVEEGPTRLCLRAVSDPVVCVEVEFLPARCGAKCVFQPSGVTRFYEFEPVSGSGLPDGTTRIRHDVLGRSLIDLVCYSGKGADEVE